MRACEAPKSASVSSTFFETGCLTGTWDWLFKAGEPQGCHLFALPSPKTHECPTMRSFMLVLVMHLHCLCLQGEHLTD